jgi:hypothetical protein
LPYEWSEAVAHDAFVRRGRNVAAIASVLAGLLWIVAWVHLRMAHGITEVNEERVVLGLTWLDSGRLIAPALAMVGIAVVALARGASREGMTRAAVVALAGLAISFAGIVLGFWTQPWGTYAGASRETGVAAIGGATVIVGSLAMAVGLIAFAVMAARARVLAGWVAVLIAVGALTSIPWLYEAAQGVGFGIAWLVTGLYLAMADAPAAVPSTAAPSTANEP